jgi:twitching motility two-component system response regulator PilH
MLQILVVDDSFTTRSIIARLIGDRYQLTLVESGAKALDLVGRQPFDLVLLDLLMPEMDGFETLARLKQAVPNLPVIILSADIQETSRRKVLEVGALAILNKPPKQPELIAAIEEVIASAGGRP